MGAKVTLNHGTAKAILKSDEVQAELLRRAKAIARAAGAGMEAESRPRTTRARAVVYTDTPEAMRAEATNRTLTKALSAGQ